MLNKCYVTFDLTTNHGDYMQLIINTTKQEQLINSIYQVDILMEKYSGQLEIGNISTDLVKQLQEKRPQYSITYKIDSVIA